MKIRWLNITLTTVNTPRACLPFLSLISVVFLSSTRARLSCTQNKKVNMVATNTCFLLFTQGSSGVWKILLPSQLFYAGAGTVYEC